MKEIKVISTKSTKTGTASVTFSYGLQGKWIFYPPYFKGVGKKPDPIVFASSKEFNAFLDTLPKNWREKMRINP